MPVALWSVGFFVDFLARCSLERPWLVVYLKIRVKINVSEDQEKDARKVVFGCFQTCFGHRASMRSPIKSRAGVVVFVELVSLRRR